MSEVRAVLLDLYDTLAWTAWPTMRAELEDRFGIGEADLLRAFAVTRERAASARTAAPRATCEPSSTGRDPGRPELVRDSMRRVKAFAENGVHLWDDSIPTLRELRARGFRTAVVSNCVPRARSSTSSGSPTKRMQCCSFEVGVAKPDAGIYRAALDALGAQPEDPSSSTTRRATATVRRRSASARSSSCETTRSRSKGSARPETERVMRDLRSLLDLV